MKCFNGKRLFALTVLLMGILTCSACVAANEPVNITILQTTDMHGSKQFASLAQLIRDERQKDPDLLLIDCGDTTRGSFEASLDGGAFMVAMMNQLKYDAWVFGNHEYRIGQDLQRKNAKAFKGDILAANLELTKESAQPGRPVLPWKIYKRKGVKVAVIGILSPYYDFWFNTLAYQDVLLISPKEALAKVMPEVRKQNPDIIILAAHMNANTGVETKTGNEEYVPFRDVLAEYPDISLMMMGHTHGKVAGGKLSPDSMTYLVQPETHAHSLAKIQITYDKGQKKVKEITSELLATKNVPAITDLPAEWKKVEVLAKEAAETKLICFPDEWVNDARNKKVQPVPWLEITGKAMCEAVGADAAIAFSCGTLRKRNFTELDMYNMIRNEINIVKLTFTPEQLKTLLAQLPQLKTRIYGLDVENLPKRNISIAVDAYDVTGCDGAYPALRIIANKIPRVDSKQNKRDVLKNYLMKHYPAENGKN